MADRKFALPLAALLGVGGVLLAFILTGAAAANRTPAPPNVVLIFTDDQGWFSVGVNGNQVIKTPNMDRIAREGVRFNRFYATPVCTPTRAGLLTGRYYQRTGAYDTYMGRDTLRADEVTLGDLFHSRGYRTGIFGKWHQGRYMRYHPNNRGFDEFFGFWQYGFINRYMDSDELWHNRQPVVTTGYVTDVLTDQAIRFVRQNRKRPFFLYLPYNAPHGPHLVPDRYIAPYLKQGVPLPDARIYGQITSIDDNLGRLLKTLEETGLAANTVVIFMTDNGGVSHYLKAGLRGNKGSVYEGGVRVPFFARWPGHFPAGAQVNVLAEYVDLFPTFAELIGAPLPKDRKIDGKSLLQHLRRGRGPRLHNYLYHQWNRVRPNDHDNWAVQDGRWKLVKGALYDLDRDPGEKTDVAAAHPAIAKRLRRRFQRWFADVTKGQAYDRVPIEVGRPDENPVELDITWAEPVGKQVKPQYRHYIRDTVDRWSERDDFIRWKIDATRAGRYAVTFSYGCDDADAGGRFRIQAGDSAVTGSSASTGGRLIFQTRRIGVLRLPKGPQTLEIHATKIVGNEPFALHKVWLKRLP